MKKLFALFCFWTIAAAAQHIGLEMNSNQKAVVGLGDAGGTVVLSDGRFRGKFGGLRLLVGDPPQSIHDLPVLPQTLLDGRTPAVVTRREYGGIQYENTAWEMKLPEVGPTFVLGLKAVNTSAHPLMATWLVEPEQAKASAQAERAALGWGDSGVQRQAPGNPWAMLSVNTTARADWAPKAPRAYGMRGSAFRACRFIMCFVFSRASVTASRRHSVKLIGTKRASA
jgi:hypothetical protein